MRSSFTAHRIAKENAFELLDLPGEGRRHEEALVDFGEVPRAGKDGTDVLGRVTVRKNQIGLVDDEVINVLEVKRLRKGKVSFFAAEAGIALSLTSERK